LDSNWTQRRPLVLVEQSGLGVRMAIFVAAYHVRVREKYKKSFEQLDSIGKSTDFFDFVRTALNEWKTEHHNDMEAERLSKMQKIETKERVIQGRILVGDYGQACAVVDAGNLSTVFNKTVQHADLLPFFFRMEIPEHRDEALFLIEKSRKTSPKTAFTKMLRLRFANVFEEYSLSIEPVMPDTVFKEYLDKGKVQKIRFIKMGLPSDIADILESGHEEILGKTEFVVTAPRNRYLPIKKSILRASDPRKTIQDLYELTDLDYDNVKVIVKIGKGSRSVDLGAKQTSPLYDITEEVKIGSDGIGTYASMSEAFESLATDINEGAYASA
jgi:hypothetical protein